MNTVVKEAGIEYGRRIMIRDPSSLVYYFHVLLSLSVCFSAEYRVLFRVFVLNNGMHPLELKSVLSNLDLSQIDFHR